MGYNRNFNLQIKLVQIFWHCILLFHTHTHTLHCDSEEGTYQKLDLTKKRPFTDIQSSETPTLEWQDSQIKEAMLQYQSLKQLHSHTILEHYCTNTQIDTMDTRLKTLEAKIGNKALLLRGLPATGFTKNNLDWNLEHFCELAGVLFDHISFISNHMKNTESSSSFEWTNIRLHCE